MEGLWYNEEEYTGALVVSFCNRSSNCSSITVVITLLLPDVPGYARKSLVVKHPDFYYYFTTNDVRNLQNLAPFCSSPPSVKLVVRKNHPDMPCKTGQNRANQKGKTYDKDNVRLPRQYLPITYG